MSGANPLLEFVERYGPLSGEDGPPLFVREVFGITPDPWQDEALRAFGRGERHISIRACHGPGKTCLGAWLVWLMLTTRFPQKTVATAPTQNQLLGGLYPEVVTWGKRMKPELYGLFEVKAHRIELKAASERSFFELRVARAERPEALQGVHADNVLLLIDEASGVPEAIFEAGVGSMTGENATTVLLGNPIRLSGTFFDSHNRMKHEWFTLKVGFEESPRVSKKFVEWVATQYGRDSNAYRIRCLGEFPRADSDSIIPFEMIESAIGRDIVVPPDLRRVWGLDVARTGDAVNALTERTRRSGRLIDVWGGVDLMQTAGKVSELWTRTEPENRPVVILIDVIGLGAGVYDRLKELGLPVRGINVGEAASIRDRYLNLKAELWFKGRDWFTKSDVTLEKDEMLQLGLSFPRYRLTSTGRIMVEQKGEVKKRAGSNEILLRAIDVSDSFILTFAEEAAILSGGDRLSWNKPLVRKLQIV